MISFLTARRPRGDRVQLFAMPNLFEAPGVLGRQRSVTANKRRDSAHEGQSMREKRNHLADGLLRLLEEDAVATTFEQVEL